MPSQTALVFDPKLWREQGYDVGDNTQCWKEAEILATYVRGNQELATIKFLHDGRVSSGHFTSSMNHHKGLQNA